MRGLSSTGTELGGGGALLMEVCVSVHHCLAVYMQLCLDLAGGGAGTDSRFRVEWRTAGKS